MSELTRALSKKLPPNWTAKTLEEVVDISSGTTPLRTKQRLYFDGGTIPWVKTGDLNNGLIRTTEESITELAKQECSSCTVYPADTVLVAMYGGFKQIGRTGRLGVPAAINQALSALQIKSGDLSAAYLQIWLNGHVGFWKRLAASSRKDPNITGSDVAAFPILLPPISEQRTIASILSAWDQAIELTEKLIAAKQKRQSSLMQSLLTGKARLPRFAQGHWRVCQLGDVASNSTRRIGTPTTTPQVYSVTNSVGMVPMSEDVIGESIDRYKTVGKHDFAYNPMRINVGSIAMWDGDEDVLVSPDYVVFQCGDELDAEFLNHFRKTHFWHQFVNRSGGGSVRVRIYFSDLAEMPLKLPPLVEQKAIAAVLNTQDREIDLLGSKLDALRRQKKGLMQQLLTGKVRVNVTGASGE